MVGLTDLVQASLARLTPDSFAFAGDDRLISDVWSAGRHMVQMDSILTMPAPPQLPRRVGRFK